MRRAAAGDKAAWSALVDSYNRLVWGVAGTFRLGPADAGEVVQITWMRLLEHIDRIEHPERLGGWLATTARHEALRLLRLRNRELPTDDESSFEPGARPEPTPEEAVLGRDRDRRLWAAFRRLSERCRTLLQMVVVDRPPYTAVAAALDMPIGSIGPTRARCLQRLRALVEAEGV